MEAWLISFVAGGLFYLVSLAGTRRLLAHWQNAIRQHSLTVQEVSGLWTSEPRLIARAGAVELRFEYRQKLGTYVWLEAPGLLADSGLKLRREGPKPWAGREIEVGDKRFDDTFIVEGSAGRVRALLDAETRRLLLLVNAADELEVGDGQLRVRVSEQELPRLLPLLLELGQRLTQAEDIVRRLAANAREDPRPGVRLRNLLQLAREHHGEPVTAESLRAACSDPSPEVRLGAAIELRAEGRETLVALAEGDEEDPWSARAVAALGRQLPVERTRAILQQALRRRRVETARACLEILGRWRDAGLDDLVQALERERGELAAVAAQALGDTREAAAEAPLVRALQHARPDVRLAAAGALGRVGSAAAVLPLKEAAEHDPDLQRVVRQAVAEIQFRLQGAAPGQLSLADTEAGQLSLAPAEAGQLSLAVDPAGQLSLPPERQRA